MKLISRYFTPEGGDDRWERMANVLRQSCDDHGVAHDIRSMATPHRTRGAAVCANHAKLKEWREEVLRATEPVILADVDTFIQRNPEKAFDEVEHIGITFRDQRFNLPIPLNAGIVFVQPTREARQFICDWCKMDKRMFEDNKLLMQWRREYQGINQSSLGCLLETGDFKPTALNCSTWNLVEPWEEVDGAHIVHVKGNAMRHIFDDEKPKREGAEVVAKRWRAIEDVVNTKIVR